MSQTTATTNKPWLKLSLMFLGIVAITWAMACTPTVASLTQADVKVDKAGLEIEFEFLLAQYEQRQLKLEQQEKLRELLTRNIVIMAETGTVDPLGVITTLAAFYGVGSAANDTRKVVKKRKAASSG